MSESSKKHKAAAPTQLNFGVFVCSTSRYQQLQKGTKMNDVSGDLIEALVKTAGHNVMFKKIISDDKTQIENATRRVPLFSFVIPVSIPFVLMMQLGFRLCFSHSLKV